MIAPLTQFPIRRADDGFIIVAVLWILAALAVLASIYSIYVTNTVISLGVNDDRLQAEALVTAGLELTAYQLLAEKAETRPTQGAFRFRLGRSDVAVEFRSEAARIDLNMAPKELLAGLFAGLGARSADAEYYADRIVGWRKKGEVEGQNNEADAYRTAGMSYGPRQGPFADVSELWLVMGLPPALVERALPFVTVFNGGADIDVIDAAPGGRGRVARHDPGSPLCGPRPARTGRRQCADRARAARLVAICLPAGQQRDARDGWHHLRQRPPHRRRGRDSAAG